MPRRAPPNQHCSTSKRGAGAAAGAKAAAVYQCSGHQTGHDASKPPHRVGHPPRGPGSDTGGRLPPPRQGADAGRRG